MINHLGIFKATRGVSRRRTSHVIACVIGAMLANQVAAAWAQTSQTGPLTEDTTDRLIRANPLLAVIAARAPSQLPDILRALSPLQEGRQSSAGLTKGLQHQNPTLEEEEELKRNPAFAEAFYYNKSSTLELLDRTMKSARR